MQWYASGMLRFLRNAVIAIAVAALIIGGLLVMSQRVIKGGEKSPQVLSASKTVPSLQALLVQRNCCLVLKRGVL